MFDEAHGKTALLAANGRLVLQRMRLARKVFELARKAAGVASQLPRAGRGQCAVARGLFWVANCPM